MTNIFKTFISKKQIGVIYRNNKLGNITVSDQVISWLYNSVAENEGYVVGNENDYLDRVKAAVDALFANDYESAQNWIDEAVNSWNCSHVESVRIA